MNSFVSSLAAAFAGIIVLGAATTVASASEDNKVYPGASCEPLNVFARYERSLLTGQLTNNGTVSQTFICPAVRDVTGISSIEFGGVTLSGSPLSGCQMVSITTLGGRFATGPTNIRPINSALRRLQFADGDPNFFAPANGSLMFVCSLAPGGAILSYSITENDGED